ncbi:MAG TPA: thiol:disulfide interchange protein DsbA/DsbL [Pseudomonadales bacterium]|nr:thiol:disulfide interchange protein DsbA/DsbL [Pseudomonadales bacterium]
MLSRVLTRVAPVALLFLGLQAPAADAASLVEPWVEGEHYVTLPVPVATGNEGVTVTEFFSYACIHCFEFDSELEAWRERQPADVTFERVPAVFSRQWMLFAQAYYVARACSVLDTTHVPMFRAIHLERRRFTSPEDVAAFYAELMLGAEGEAQCSTEDDFLKAFNSFGVGAAVQQAMGRGRAYQASGVPTMIVDGTWRTDGRSAGSNDAMLEVVDHLVRRARAATAVSAADPARPAGVAGGP